METKEINPDEIIDKLMKIIQILRSEKNIKPSHDAEELANSSIPRN